MTRTRWIGASLLVGLALLSCRADDDPSPITSLALPEGALGLALLREAPDGLPVLAAVAPDETVRRVEPIGEAVRVPVPVGEGPWAEVRWVTVRGPVPRALVPVSADVFAVDYGGDPRDQPLAAAARFTALVRRDGTLTLAPFRVEPAPARELQQDASGRLYFADLPALESLGALPDCVWSLGFDGGLWKLAEPRTPTVDRVRGYVVDDGGNVAYRGVRLDGRPRPNVIGFQPASAPPLLWDDVGPLGALFRAGDGRIHLTRGLGDVAGTTELLRIDFGAEPVATPVATWVGAPGELDGEPLELGASRAFVRPGEVVVLSPDAVPAVHALGFVHRDVRASPGALWFVAEGASGAPTRIVRWSDGEAVELLPPETFDVERVEPYGDAGALAGVIRRSDGARLLLRVTAGGAPERVDAGLSSPALLGGLRLP